VKVARLHGVGELRLHDESPPEAAPDETLVRVAAVGICGSDLHWFSEGGIGDAKLRAPLVIGHEIAGTVEAGALAGRVVAVDPAIPCGVCATCARGLGHLCPTVLFCGHGELDGGLREVMTWPTRRLHPLPPTLTVEDGAMLEPLGVAIHAVDLGHVRVGNAVVVVGCGPIGLMIVQLARQSGANTVVAVDPLGHRRQAAERLGADVALTPDEALDPHVLTDASRGIEADPVFEVAGPDLAVALAVRAARPGGRVVLVGIPDVDRTTFPASEARRKGLTLMLSRRMGEVYPRAINLAAQRLVDIQSIVSHRYSLDDVTDAFETACQRLGHKVLVEPPQSGGPAAQRTRPA
jgi:L-iditol 2-dehydrogenase